MCVHGHQVNWDAEAWKEYSRGLTDGTYLTSDEVEARRVARVGREKADEMAAAEEQAKIDALALAAMDEAYKEAEKRIKAEALREKLRAQKQLQPA